VKRVLVVDDEPKITQLVRDYLERGGFAVTTASDGTSALALARSERPDLVILDLGLPDRDGLDVTRALRRDSTIPLIVLTARAEESDRLVGLELGADDYVTKPFSPKELVARVRAVLRRSSATPADDELIRVGDVIVDVPRRRVSVADRGVDLTATEFELVATLARHPGRVFSRKALLEELWGGSEYREPRTIDVHVRHLREKLEVDPAEPEYILTVRGVGYRFRDR
jgi:two-component system OmpR family response regulator/two-component system alkaline phosphatase synthesis response regulator PhoP